MLSNVEYREIDRGDLKLEVNLEGKRHIVSAGRMQILHHLLSAYDTATIKSRELEDTQRKLREQESTGSLASGMAHDFNNLLAVINGYSEMIIEGTGMGLAVVDGIVKCHGGVIEVESSIGHGTTIRVFFPVLKDRSAGTLTMRIPH